MAKPEWGVKRKCMGCEATFYDFNKTPPTCPKCSKEFKKEEINKDIEVEEEIPQNKDEIIIEPTDEIEENDDEDDENDVDELDVEEDLQQIDPNVVSDDDIDNVFIEGSIDISDIEEDIKIAVEMEEDEL